MSKHGVKIVQRQKIDMYIMANQKYLPAEKIIYLKDKLRRADDEKFTLISTVEMKDPSKILIISIFLGILGIDRFILGDIKIGILKLLTVGGCGILAVTDWFTVSKRVKDLNYNRIMALL